LLSPEEARAAQAYRSRQGGTLPLAVVELGFQSAQQLAEALSRTLCVPLISAEEMAALPPSLTSVIPGTMAAEHRVVPVKRGNDRLLLAISEPTNQHGMEEVAFFTGLTVVPAVAAESDLSAALYHYYGVGAPPAETGPLAVQWRPVDAAVDATSPEPAADVPTLGPPVELSVRARDETEDREFEELDLDEPLPGQPEPPTPLQPPVQVASAASPAVQNQYGCLDWWLGKDAEPNVVMRKPKHVDAPAAHQDSISHDQVLGLPPQTTEDLFSEEILDDALTAPGAGIAAPAEAPPAPPVTPASVDSQPTGSIPQAAPEATAAARPETPPADGTTPAEAQPLFITPAPLTPPATTTPEAPPAPTEEESGEPPAPATDTREPRMDPAAALPDQQPLTDRLHSPETPGKRTTRRLTSPTHGTERLTSPAPGAARSAAAPADRAVRTTDQLHAVPDPATEPWALDPALQALAEATDREQVVHLALPYLLQRWARAAMFVIREGMVLGLDGSGEGLQSRTIRGMIVPLNAPSIFKTVYDSGQSYIGPPPKSTINTMCFKALGVEPDLTAVGPLALRSGAVVALLYADSGTSGKGDGEDPYFEMVRASVARALENILIRAKGGR